MQNLTVLHQPRIRCITDGIALFRISVSKSRFLTDFMYILIQIPEIFPEKANVPSNFGSFDPGIPSPFQVAGR